MGGTRDILGVFHFHHPPELWGGVGLHREFVLLHLHHFHLVLRSLGGTRKSGWNRKKKKKSNLTWKSQPLTPKRCRFDKRNTPGFGSLFPRQKGIKGEGGKESLKSKNHKAQSRKKKIPKIRISLHSPDCKPPLQP